MGTPAHEHWTDLTVRCPDDVRTSTGGRVSLAWQVEKRAGHVDRLMNRTLPADFPGPVERGDVGDVLAVLALSESMRRDLAARRGGDIREAILLGPPGPRSLPRSTPPWTRPAPSCATGLSVSTGSTREKSSAAGRWAATRTATPRCSL